MAHFKAFISESDLEERKKKRQEEWEKVRKPEDPVERPEEEYDCRSLYDKLKEQKDKQQAEFEEAHKFKNMIRGLDDDEVQFLDLVDRTKEEIEAQRWKEDFHEIRDFQKAVANLAEQSAEHKLQEIRKTATNLLNLKGEKKSQHTLLAAAVKRKSVTASDTSPNKKSKSSADGCETSGSEPSDLPQAPKRKSADYSDKSPIVKVKQNEEEGEISKHDVNARSQIDTTASDGDDSNIVISPVHCIGVLPGLGVYSDSSDSDDSDECILEQPVKFDLLGRPRFQNVDDH